MIVSHKYRFIFLKTNKTAGTSIEIALSKFCGGDDIITPLLPNDELIRNHLGYRGPQNYLAPMSDYGPIDFFRMLTKGCRKVRYFGHFPAQSARSLLGEEIWNSYYKFCFERNPWERVISYYYWRYQAEPRPSLSQFIESDIPMRLKKRGIQLYTIRGRIVVDRVCLYERLETDLEEVRLRIGLPEQIVLPRAKAYTRKNRSSYHEILDAAQMQKVEELFGDEIRLFGYRCMY